jgi:integrase
MVFNNLLTNETSKFENELSILFWLFHAKRSKKSGKYPLYCRITLNGQRATEIGFSTGIKINTPEEWKSELQLIIPNKNATAFEVEQIKLDNDRIARMSLDIQKVFALFELSGKPFSALDIQNEYLNKKSVPVSHTIKDLADDWEKLFQKRVDIGEKSDRTLISYQDYNNKILTYFGENKPLHEFTEIMWEELRLYLLSVVITQGKNKGKTLHINTVAKVMGHFNTLFQHAKKLRWLPTFLYEDYHPNRIDTETIALTMKQLDMLWELKTQNETLRIAVDIFLFLASTGFSYSDYCELTTENFVLHELGRQYIIKEYRYKSPVLERYGKSIVPIFERAKIFLDKYGVNPDLWHKPDSHDVNDALKIAWEIIGVRSDMALKNSRHTFINYARTILGLPEHAITNIVGHSSVRTTEKSYLIRDVETVEQDLKRAGL